MTKLIPQDYQMLNDKKGSRKKTTPQDLSSGTYFGQMQLRGSILVIKDNSTTASGFISYGTSMSTIPTSRGSGDGLYIDYLGMVMTDTDDEENSLLTWYENGIYVGGLSVLDVPGSDTDIGYWHVTGTPTETIGEIVLSAVSDPASVGGNSFAKLTLHSEVSSIDGYALLDANGVSSIGRFRVARTGAVSAHTSGLIISNTTLDNPSSLLHLKSTAPTFRMEDTTASAKSLLVTVDANLATFGEVTGGTFFTLDLANKDVKLDGDLLFTDATYDIGASGATRPRHLYLSGNIVAGGTFTSSGNHEISNTAPTLTFTDTTGSANDAIIKVDGNKMYLQDATDTDGDMLTLDLANARVGIGIAAPTNPFQVVTSVNNAGVLLGFTGSSSASVCATNSMYVNDGAAIASGDRIGALQFGAYDGTAVVFSAYMLVKTTEGWATTTNRGSKIEIYTTPNASITTTLALTIGQDQSALFTNSIKSSSATAGIGYATGAGGTVTQLTSKSTGVTLSKVCGAITMNNAALAGDTTVSFTLTNTAIAATDVLTLNHISGGTIGSYLLNAQCAAGSATINVRNITTGSLSEAIVIQFAVIKGVNA